MSKIETINKLHDEAMEFAEKAFSQQRKKEIEASVQSFSKAFEIEKKAAMLLANDFDIEPTRAVLFKGAANLAFNGELYREAEKMASFALAGNPSEEIAAELRELINLIKIRTTENSPIDKYLHLPENLKREVADFIEFLTTKYNAAA